MTKPGFVRLIGKGNISEPPLDEDSHAVVDQIISDMSRKKPTHYEIICKCYLHHMQDVEIGRSMKPDRMSRSKIREIRLGAEHYIEGRLE